MPHYFYNLEGVVDFVDNDGIDLVDTEAAKTEAIRFLAETLDACAETFNGGAELRLTVCDEHLESVLAFTFSMNEAPVSPSESHASSA